MYQDNIVFTSADVWVHWHPAVSPRQQKCFQHWARNLRGQSGCLACYVQSYNGHLCLLEVVIFWQCDQASWHKLLHPKSIEEVPCSDGTVDEQVCRGIDHLRGKEISSCKKEISVDKDGDIGQKNMGGKSKDKCRDQCMATLMIIWQIMTNWSCRSMDFIWWRWPKERGRQIQAQCSRLGIRQVRILDIGGSSRGWTSRADWGSSWERHRWKGGNLGRD